MKLLLKNLPSVLVGAVLGLLAYPLLCAVAQNFGKVCKLMEKSL